MANKQMHHLKVGDNIFEIVDSVARSGISGAPTIVSLSSAMNDTSKLYLYIGSETGYTRGDWYYHNGTSWVSGGQYGDMQLDTSLTTSGMAADAKSVGDRFNSFATTATAGQTPIADGAGGWQWGDVATSGDSVPTNVRQALYSLLNNNAFANDSQYNSQLAVLQSWATEVTAITLNRTSLSFGSVQAVILQATTVPSGASVIWSTSDASVATVNNGVVTPVGNGNCTITASAGSKKATCAVSVSAFANVTSISAVYSGTIYYDDDLNDLKEGLVVTALYSDGTTTVVSDSDYVLSGTLTTGTSTITVEYSGVTTTVNVTVSAPLYNIPDFEEKSITISGNTYTLKKEGGYYEFTAGWSSVMYVDSSGALSSTKSNSMWFATIQDAPIVNEIRDITWNNPNNYQVDLNVKFSQSDATGNLATAAFTMAAGSGTDGYATYENESYNERHISNLALQIGKTSTMGAIGEAVSVTFRHRLYVDGVRYL